MATLYGIKPPRYILQGRGSCKFCKRTVDVVSTDHGPGLLLSAHLDDSLTSLCGLSLTPYDGALTENKR